MIQNFTSSTERTAYMDQEMATMLLTADGEKGIVATHCTVCRWNILRYVEGGCAADKNIAFEAGYQR